jgi:multiple sugar transport system substrate-binding protein
VNPEGTELEINKPAAVEVLQKLQDLIYVDHVAPTPTASKNLPTSDILLESGKVAIAIDGMWKVTDFANLHFPWGVGVLPKFKTAETVIISTPKVIFAATKHPQETFEFYKFIADPTKVDLFKQGLWAPLEKSYFTDPGQIASWLTADPGVYPPESISAIVDYTVNHAPNQPPAYWLKNYGQIDAEAIGPALDQLWSGKLTAQQAADLAVANAKPLLAGKY